MIITRWQAALVPSQEQAIKHLEDEGLDPFIEQFPSGYKIPGHRHPYSEVRMVLTGEIFFNIAGNQLVLRPGDQIEIPPNTKHSHSISSDGPCTCACAFKI